jgi:hypothetical protein
LDLRSAHAKFQRALELVDDFIAFKIEFERAISHCENLELNSELNRDGVWDYKVVANDNDYHQMQNRFSDALANFDATIEHVAFALNRDLLTNTIDFNDVRYPITNESSRFGSQPLVQRLAGEGHWQVFHALKSTSPWKREGVSLWHLRQLNNVGKHHTLLSMKLRIFVFSMMSNFSTDEHYFIPVDWNVNSISSSFLEGQTFLKSDHELGDENIPKILRNSPLSWHVDVPVYRSDLDSIAQTDIEVILKQFAEQIERLLRDLS